MSDKTPAPKPCPFCGASPDYEVSSNRGWVTVFCVESTCQVMVQATAKTLKGAINLWNRRTP